METVGVVVAALAAWYDVKTREIPDWITLTLILSGIIFSLANRGFLFTVGILFLGSIFCELIYYFKVFGGGDLKLFLGLLLAGGPFYGLAVFYVSLLAALPLFLYYMLKEKTRKPSAPYAVAILVAVLWLYGKGVKLY